MIEQLKTTYHLSETQLCQLNLMLQIKKEYLETAFATIEQEYGDFKSYVTEGLLFSEDDIAHLRSLYVVAE